ncbi:MAG: ABC transporter substrate-binding protein [Planctomycetota bacterium]|nr:ABC transporter substrate-binding protein [Planctomycetota bacterium]
MAAKKKSAKKKAAKKAAKKATPKKAAKKKAAAAKPGEAAPEDLAAAVLAAIAGEVPEVEEEVIEPILPPLPKMPKRREDGVITLGHGSESDQAFMVYALAMEKVDTEDRRYELHRAELQDLEQTAAKAKYDVTAISFGAYPALRDRYLLLACGGAYGDHQGPVLVARKPIRTEEIQGLEVGVPGEDSAGALALRLWLPRAGLALQGMSTREISLRVRANHVRSGLLVNEDILTYRNHNLVRVVDLGQWWGDRTEGLPLALNAHVVRRDIDAELRGKIALDLKRSIAYALGHREEALDWAMQFAGKLDRETLDRYIQRYVNDLSLDCGERGRQAARKLFEEGHRHGFLPQVYEPVYHGDEQADL